MLGIPRQRRFAQDHQAVDRDAPREHFVAHLRDVAAGIVGAVARHIDGAAHALEGSALELGHGEFEPGADRRAIRERARQFEHLIADLARRGRVADDRPVDDQLERACARPFDEADRDLAVRAGPDRLDHARIGQCRRVALALQLEFPRVDAARDVGGEHQQEIHVLVGAGRRGKDGEESDEAENGSNQTGHCGTLLREAYTIPCGAPFRTCAAAPHLTPICVPVYFAL